MSANGYCHWWKCNNEVPEDMLNKFYCSDDCRQMAWNENHPEKEDYDD